MSFAEQWAALDAEEAGPGEVRRRIHPHSRADMWLVMYRPSQVRALRVAVGFGADVLADLPGGQGIGVELNAGADGTLMLEVTLTSRSYEDLFDAFVTDIAAVAAQASSAQEVPELVASRVRRWQAFLREHIEGLSSERQRGLFGELHVLESVIESMGADSAAAGWVGPFGAPQDFAFGRSAVEVKTSAGKNPQTVRISSERQLDDSAVDRLYLWHLSVDERQGAGETLPALVENLRRRVAGRQSSVRLEEALLAAGYHDVHTGLYSTGYSLRASSVFLVAKGFPRLVEADCPAGLGDVHYSLELGALKDFAIERRLVLEALEGVPSDE